MSDQEPDLEGLERVEKQSYPTDTPETPRVSVVNDGSGLSFLKNCYQELGEPNYVSYYKSGSKVFIVPLNDESGATNPHKVNADFHMASFGWHPCEKTGTAPLKWDDERNVHYFDTKELGDSDE